MRLINKDTDYALKALAEIARRGGEVTAVPALTAALGLRRPYLRKILQALARDGIVRSLRGKGGGFVLGRRADRIRLTDVIRVFQGAIKLQDCVFKNNVCPDVRTCPVRKTLAGLEARFVADLEAVTIAELLRKKSRPRRDR